MTWEVFRGQQTYSDEEIFDALRVAAEKSEAPHLVARPAYEVLRREGDPSVETIIIRFQRWKAALEAAGLPVSSRRGNTNRKFTDTEILQAVSTAMLDVLPEELTYARYEEVKREGAPSGPLVRKRLRHRIGTWNEIKASIERDLGIHREKG